MGGATKEEVIQIRTDCLQLVTAFGASKSSVSLKGDETNTASVKSKGSDGNAEVTKSKAQDASADGKDPPPEIPDDDPLGDSSADNDGSDSSSSSDSSDSDAASEKRPSGEAVKQSHPATTARRITTWKPVGNLACKMSIRSGLRCACHYEKSCPT